jgi:response regulator RpfG family c-di-GMP phosphodiesterase
MGYVFQQSQLAAPRAVEVVTPVETGEIALVERVLAAFEVRDPGAAAHVQRMAAVAGLLADRLAMSASEVWMIRVAASLHDIGKLTVNAGVLWKPGTLTAAERTRIEGHTIAGHNMLSGADTPIFRLAATIALTHHERWDGDGYPLGLRGVDIPPAGRIAAVADVFDALLSARPYRPALELAEATTAIEDGRGSHFDPEVVDALFSDLGGALAAREGAAS